MKFSAHSMAAWLFLFSLNTFETEKDQVLAFATTGCLWSADCACLFNVLAFQFLDSLSVITLLFLCFTHNLQIIKLTSDLYFFDHICWKLRTVKLYALLADCLLSFSLLWMVGSGFILFHFWGFWFVVLCGNWEAIELAIYNLLFQSETFLWCRALTEIKSAETISDLVSRTNENVYHHLFSKKTDAPAGPSKGFLMRHLKNMRTLGRTLALTDNGLYFIDFNIF